MKLNDIKRIALTNAGYVGTVTEMERQMLLDDTGLVSGKLNDLWRIALFNQGYSGDVNDMQMEWLGDLGYSGTWNERMLQFWTNRAVSTYDLTIGVDTGGWYGFVTPGHPVINPIGAIDPPNHSGLGITGVVVNSGGIVDGLVEVEFGGGGGVQIPGIGRIAIYIPQIGRINLNWNPGEQAYQTTDFAYSAAFAALDGETVKMIIDNYTDPA